MHLEEHFFWGEGATFFYTSDKNNFYAILILFFMNSNTLHVINFIGSVKMREIGNPLSSGHDRGRI